MFHIFYLDAIITISHGEQNYFNDQVSRIKMQIPCQNYKYKIKYILAPETIG
ncbi:MAG: hypothetical protein JWN78_702 [Bacteroidota bacterium]|nr:hypothetical protein [Bacteroidota bacterium]